MKPIMEKLVVVPESSVRRGNHYRRFLLVGWVLGLVGVGFGIGMVVSYHSHTQALLEVTEKINETVALQNKETAAFVKAWEDQQKSRDIILNFADLVRERNEIVMYNEENGAVPRLPKKKVVMK